jgi:hypothetical protein
MTPSASVNAFEKFVEKRGGSLPALTVRSGIQEMLAFYESVLPTGCVNERGDMLLFQWGTYDWGTALYMGYRGARFMSQSIRNRLSIRSRLARRIAKVFFGAIVIVYVTFISYSYYGRLDSSRHVMQLGTLWCLGSVAIALIVRSLWKERKQ